MTQPEEAINIQHDEDYAYEQYLEQEKLNEEYWEQKAKEDAIDTINAMYETRFCFADVMSAVIGVTENEELADKIGEALNTIYVRRITFDTQING
jgi:hypothetical protein